MRKILPFKGIVYNQDKIKSLADVMSPPYDVIEVEQQSELHARSVYNFCRLDLPVETGEGRYTQAKKIFSEWMSQDVLIADKRPALYIHRQTFSLPDGKRTYRCGIFAACGLEDFASGGIKPHEKTLEGPKRDRLQMTRATLSNLSPVFVLYADPERQIQQVFSRLQQGTPFVDFVDENGHRHEMWRLSDDKLVGTISDSLSDKPLFIADGHHRYETALAYRAEVAAAKGGELPENAAVNFTLIYLTNTDDEGLCILPIHRLVQGVTLSMEDFIAKVSENFSVMTLKDVKEGLQEMSRLCEKNHAYIVVGLGQSHLIRLTRGGDLTNSLMKGFAASLADLDVTVLHHCIFKNILGLSEESQTRQENISYIKSAEEVILKAHQNAGNIGFILNPTRIEDVKAVALAGEKMPQKSTFFFPKIISGLIVRSLVGGEDG